MTSALIPLDPLDRGQVVTLTTIRNPFDRSVREIKYVDVGSGLPLEDFLEAHVDIPEDQEYHVLIRGAVYGPDELFDKLALPGDGIAVCPVLKGGGDGKNPLAILAGIALAFVAFAWVGPMVGINTTTGMLTTAGRFAAGLTMMIGGQLISNAFAPSMEMGEDTQSYKWGQLQPITSQGAVIPMTYGTVRTAGQVLGQHTSTEGDNQYLSILLSGGEGPIDEFTDFRVDDNPAENYQDVKIDTRRGDNDQSVIDGFDAIYDDLYPQFTLEVGKKDSGEPDPNRIGEWSTIETTGDSVEGLEIEFTFPAGLFKVNKKGGTDTNFVRLEVEYGLDRGGSISYRPWAIPNEGKIEEKKTSSWTHVMRLDHLPVGRYSVRARCMGKGSVNSTEGASTVVWTKLSSIIYEPLTYPGKSLVGIRVKATEQLSGGMPTITWKQTRKKVWVYDGGWQERDAQNPAWIIYDLCVKCRRLSGEYVVFGEQPERMDIEQFKCFAAFNDRLVNGRPAMRMNLMVDQAKNLWEWCSSIATSARGAVVLKGTRISVVWDAPAKPVQMFSTGNIAKESFSGEFLPKESRANAVEISFQNEAKNYERDEITVYPEGFGSAGKADNPVSVQLVGITDLERAYREGMYRLAQNKYILRTLTFKIDIDAIACQVGDVILVQHDVPRWGQGGRISTVDGNTLIADNYLKRETGSMRIQLRRRDDTIVQLPATMLTDSSSSQAGETRRISVSGHGAVPGDVFAIGMVDALAKPFKIQEMSRNKDLSMTITCTEYVEEIYSDSFKIPDTNDPNQKVNAVTNLVFYPTGYYANPETSNTHQWIAELWVRWSFVGARPIQFEVQFKHDDGLWGVSRTTVEQSIQCELRDATGLYHARVRGLYATGEPSPWVYATSEGVILGNGIPPDPPTELEAVGLLGQAALFWVNPENADLDHIEIWQATEDDREQAKQVGISRSDNFNHPIPGGGTPYYWVRAVNQSGQKSVFNAEAGTGCIVDPSSIQAIIDKMMEDPTMQQAMEEAVREIAPIDDLNESLSANIIKNAVEDFHNVYYSYLQERAAEKQAEAGINGALQEYGNFRYSLAAIIDEAKSREDLGYAMAEKLEGVVAMIGDPNNPGSDTVYAAVMDLMRVIATEDEALATRINSLFASIGDAENPGPGTVYAAIRTEENARATADTATADRIDTVASIIGDPNDPQPGTAFGAIRTTQNTFATAIEAEAVERKNLQAQLNTDVGAVNAKIEQESLTRVRADEALSRSVSTVQSEMGGNRASIETLSQSINGLNAQWGVKLDVGGYVSGLTSVNNGQTSSFVMLTDNFYVARPGSPKEMVFGIGKRAEGGYGVSIANAFIAEAAITTLRVAGRAITHPTTRAGNYPLSSTGSSWVDILSVPMTDGTKDEPIVAFMDVNVSITGSAEFRLVFPNGGSINAKIPATLSPDRNENGTRDTVNTTLSQMRSGNTNAYQGTNNFRFQYKASLARPTAKGSLEYAITLMHCKR